MSNLSQEDYLKSISEPELFWADQASKLSWFQKWHTVSDCSLSEGKIAWFLGGKINLSVNCLDRHLKDKADKPAIIWQGNEPNESRIITYNELFQEVCRVASLLRSLGVTRGTRVTIYLPMIPQAAIAMLACARIGAVHSVVFAGFSAEALASRIIDCQSEIVITADQAKRGEKVFNLKEIVDSALTSCPSVKNVVVVERTKYGAPVTKSRDIAWDTVVPDNSEPEILDSEDPLFILYTSGSTGKPKGVLHTQAGYLLGASFSMREVFDLQDSDIFFCTADVGWITGHSYVVYGPLANGVTTVMFESTPTYPDASRLWQVVENFKVTVLYTAPTAIRTLLKEGDSFVTKHDRSSLRVLGTVGEPIGTAAWNWFSSVVGEHRCPIVDTWWQTETGSIMISARAANSSLKAGSACKPMPGVSAIVVTPEGAVIKETEASGFLCINKPWPSMLRSIYGDHQRFIDTYLKPYPGMYFTGDGATRDSDGDYWISGRVDDVLNVAGHRLGTAEIEAAVCRTDFVAEAAVVGFPHEIKGEAVSVFCVLKKFDESGPLQAKQIREMVRQVLSSIATPDRIYFVTALPKTRSGKIMRRILRKLLLDQADSLGDVSTLIDPQVIESIAKVIKIGHL